MNLLNSILNWYFKKEALPYWCMFLIDTATIFFSGLFTFKSLINSNTDCVRAFRCGKNTFCTGEVFSSFKNIGLLNRCGFHQSVIVKLRECRTHSVITKTACVVSRRNEITAECIHFCKRTNHSGVTKVVSINAASKAWA